MCLTYLSINNKNQRSRAAKDRFAVKRRIEEVELTGEIPAKLNT